MKKLNTKLIDKICKRKEKDVIPILCFKDTLDNEKNIPNVINILIGNGYPVRYNINSYLRSGLFITIQTLEENEDSGIEIDYISNYTMFKDVERATLTTPVDCNHYLLYSCNSIEDLMVNDEELE